MTRIRQREAAIAALIELQTIPKAAAKIRVSQATLSAWLQDPEFSGAYRAALLAKFEHSLGMLQVAAEEAVSVLTTCMRTGDKNDLIKMRAAREVLELGRIASNRDVLRRLEVLERALAQRKEQRT